MKNRIFKAALISFITLCFFGTAYAADSVNITLKVQAGNVVLFNGPETVAACAESPEADAPITINGKCAIEQSGIPYAWTWYDFDGDGKKTDGFLDKLGDYSSDFANNRYWSWSLNGTQGQTGLNQYKPEPGDILSLDYLNAINILVPTGGGPLITDYIPPLPTTVPAPVPVSAPIKPTFDLKKAYSFLVAQQKNDGSFGAGLYTDWTAFALATSKLNLDEKYFLENKLSGNFLTDYERRAMALMALGLNPYNTNGENYIEKITSSFDGKQFGDINQDNDDIFALIVLQNAGYKKDDPIINTDINFILSTQNENGSWDNSVDMTGAAIESLSALSPNPEIVESFKKAENFLKQNQKDDGSWNENASSTAWALEGILALSEKPEDWSKNGNSPFDYLATIQDTDGGIKNESLNNKIWETAYVVSVLSGKDWNQIMQNFEKPTTIQEKSSVNSPKTIPKIQKTKSENTAAVINAISGSPAPATTEQPVKKNWFIRLLENIF
jgi:hypothetical protein